MSNCDWTATVSNYTKLFIMTTTPLNSTQLQLANIQVLVRNNFEMCKNLIKSELFICIRLVWELNTQSAIIQKVVCFVVVDVVVVVVAICCTNEFCSNLL